MKALWELLFESIQTLTVNKMRTFLAILGIVIGIGSVIALISLGQASQQAIQSRIQSLGSNLLTVIPGSPTLGGVRGAAGGDTSLTYADAQAIATSPQVTTVAYVAPEVIHRAQVVAGNNNTNTQVLGITNAYMMVHNLSMQIGNFISQSDVASVGKVAVLGPQVAATLFPGGSNPIGQSIRINNISFRVIGVTVSVGGSGFGNQDDTVFVPLTTAQQLLFGMNYLSNIAISAKSPDVMTEAENQIGYVLLARHHLPDPSKADFSILSQSEILSAVNQTTGTFTTLLSGVAAISLLVGGIGIMNIMLVTVNERTREIGLRKALGARKRIIIMQFLTEAIILTVIGGIIGMLLGIIISYIFSLFTSLPFIISFSSIILAFFVSAGIGVLFGWYPANRAANLQPIEALRYE